MTSLIARELAWWKPHLTHWARRFSLCGASGSSVGWTNPKGAHVLYRGLNDLSSVDWDTVVGVSSPTQADPTRIATMPGFVFANSSTYIFALRAIGFGGAEEQGISIIKLVTNGSGIPLAPAPNSPTGLSVVAQSGGKFLISWGYNPTGQQIAPALYAVYHDNGTGTVDYENPIKLTPLTIVTTDAYAHGTTVKFVVRTRANGGKEDDNTNVVTGTAVNQSPDPISDFNWDLVEE